jgi:hypothetical protein
MPAGSVAVFCRLVFSSKERTVLFLYLLAGCTAEQAVNAKFPVASKFNLPSPDEPAQILVSYSGVINHFTLNSISN